MCDVHNDSSTQEPIFSPMSVVADWFLTTQKTTFFCLRCAICHSFDLQKTKTGNKSPHLTRQTIDNTHKHLRLYVLISSS